MINFEYELSKFSDYVSQTFSNDSPEYSGLYEIQTHLLISVENANDGLIRKINCNNSKEHFLGFFYYLSLDEFVNVYINKILNNKHNLSFYMREFLTITFYNSLVVFPEFELEKFIDLLEDKNDFYKFMDVSDKIIQILLGKMIDIIYQTLYNHNLTRDMIYYCMITMIGFLCMFVENITFLNQQKNEKDYFVIELFKFNKRFMVEKNMESIYMEFHL